MIIVKVGGGAEINWDYVCKDIVSLIQQEAVILVHGANAKRDEVAKKLGSPTKYLTAPFGNKSVYTDKQALEILLMVYSGLVNKQIVSKLQALGVNAVGLSGADGKIWLGHKKKYLLDIHQGRTKLISNTFTGKVDKVNAELINILIEAGNLPVITQPAITATGELINTDNDRNLAVMAQTLGVKKLVVLFEAPGLLKDLKDNNSLVPYIKSSQLDNYWQYCQGKMKKKLMGAKEAFQSGVETIYWGDGRIKKPVLTALAGKGSS